MEHNFIQCAPVLHQFSQWKTLIIMTYEFFSQFQFSNAYNFAKIIQMKRFFFKLFVFSLFKKKIKNFQKFCLIFFSLK